MARAKKPTKSQPIASPEPAATLIGMPATKLPAKPRPRKLPPPPPSPATPVAVPRPQKTKVKAPAIDPAKVGEALTAVLAAPDDDAPRVAYAALGDARGDFVAVGLALAARGDRNEQEDAATQPLWDRFRELHGRHAAKWTKALKALGKQTRWRWHRGFVRELRINGWDAGCTPLGLAGVLAAEPVIELAIEGGAPELVAQLLAVPGIERVQRLAISGWSAQDGGAIVGKLLAAASRLTAVTELRAGVKLGDEGIAALARAKTLGAVVHLAIGAGECSTATFAALAASPLGQRLEILEWLRDEITQDMARIVVTMPSLRTFVGSIGAVAAAQPILAGRFRDRFKIEDEPGMHYLLDGVKGISHRPEPKR